LISTTPSAASARASATMSAIARLRCGPRSFGMMQNAHGRSQPSAILTYAVWRAPIRTRGASWS
jgi:hypothetical protein